MHLSALKWDE
jgi:hypothetical protein